MADPNLDIPPNFAGPEFDIIRQGLRAGFAENDQQVTERLLAAWQANNDARVAAWDAQRAEDGRAAAENERIQQEQQQELERAQKEEEERERRDADKKKPKMNTFTPGTAPPNVLEHPPSQYALQKLSTFDYVELYYFSLRGRLEAARHSNRSHADDTFGIARVDDHLTVRSIASVRASKYVIPDHDLTFEEFLHAKNCFLEHAVKAGWPQLNTDALSAFFWFLENHPMIHQSLGPKIILTYASRVRLDWHKELKAGRGYDISKINDSLIQTIAASLRADEDDENKAEVSTTPSNKPSQC